MNANPSPAKGLDSTVGVFGYLCLCLNVFFFSFILAADPQTFGALSREDCWVENLTAVWFLLAGILLFVTARAERSFLRRCVYILGGMAMVFAAGEEISWGQRIFEFTTPDFLMSLNAQQEFNVHNINQRMFDVLWLNGALILCMVTSAAFFCRKDRLWGIPLPSIPLMLGFLLILSYDSGENLKEYLEHPEGYVIGITQYFGYIVIEQVGLLLLLLLIFALLSGKSNLVIASTATVALVLALTYLNYNHASYIGEANAGDLWEVREYLFGMGCLFYCLEFLTAQGRLAAISRTSFSALKPAGGRISFQMMTCRLVIAGSIGLMFFVYFNATADFEKAYRSIPAGEEAYWSIPAGEPAVRSNFDIYLHENMLTYVKEPCARADTEATFFLHLIPIDANDLPDQRRQYGFDNLDFDFDERGVIFDGKCMVRVPLPEYDITRIVTGQYVVRSVLGGFKRFWEEEIHLER